MISIVAAMSENRVIGLNNKLPWYIPEELQHFKQLTMGKPMIMGRKTFDSIGRRLLPGRQTIVVTRANDLVGEGFTVVNSIAAAIQAANTQEEIMVVGGAGIYREFMPLCQRIYLSVIPQQLDGDAFFPEFDTNLWKLVAEQEHPKFTVKTYEV